MTLFGPLPSAIVQPRSAVTLAFRFVSPSGVCFPVMTFFRRIYDPEIGSGAVDVYAMMFACQFIIFIIIVSSWSAFSSPEVNKHTNIAVTITTV